MLLPPKPHQKWDPVRQASYSQVEALLYNRFGLFGLCLTTINRPAVIAFNAWKSHAARGARRWPWPSLIHEFRRDDPACFEAAVWSGSQLCGMALGEGDETASYCSVDYMEAEPSGQHLLKGHILDIVLTTLVVYTALLGRAEIRLIDPSQYVQRWALGHPSGGYSLVRHPGQRQYLHRSIL